MRKYVESGDLADGAIVEISTAKAAADAFKSAVKVLDGRFAAVGIGGALLAAYAGGSRTYQTEVTPPMGMSKGVSVALVRLEMGVTDSGHTAARLWVEDHADARLLGVFRDSTGLNLATGKINQIAKALDPVAVRLIQR